MTRAIAAIVLAPLAAMLLSGAMLTSVAPTPPPEPVEMQRVWVEQDGERMWEVVCPASLTARQCLERDVVSDLLGDRADAPDRTLFFDASAEIGSGTLTVHTARLSGCNS